MTLKAALQDVPLDDSGHPRIWATRAGEAGVQALMDADTQENKNWVRELL